MATIPQSQQSNSLRQNIANTGGNILKAISSINPALGGAAGKAVDVISKATGNYFPETGASERAESAGGVAKPDPVKEAARAKELGIPMSYSGPQVDPNIGQSKEQFSTSDSLNDTPAGRSPLMSERAQGANVGDVRGNERWTGVSWEKLNVPGPETPKISGEDILGAATKSEGSEFLNQGDLQSLMDKYGGSSQDRMDQLAKDIEDTATANAEREYGTIKDALGVQKGEIQTLSAQQKEQLAGQKKLTEEGLTEKQTSEAADIEKQKIGFEQETEATKEELATNWRDLSLEMQRVMRGRGVSDSAFASSQDSKLMLDFNKGLRQIAVKSTAAYNDFADAVIETNKYYTRQRAQLDFDFNKANTDVDNWTRQNVQSIQAQENVALNKKLSDIKNAILQGNQLKVQTAQKIEDQKLGLATWMYQFQAQLKASVATAAAGKVDDAWKNIAAVRANTDIIKTVLENGGEFVKKAGAGGTDQWFVHGPAINSDGSFDYVDLPVTEGYVNTQTLKTASQISGGSDMFSGMTGGKPSFESAYGAVAPKGLSPITNAIKSK